MEPSGKELAFVVGHYKAGSTWLLRLLCLHPQIRGLAETHIFHHVQRSPDLDACSEILFEGGVPWSAGGQRRWVMHRVERLGAWLLRPHARIPGRDRPSTLLDMGYLAGLGLRRELARADEAAAYVRTFFAHVHGRLKPPAYLLEKTPRNIRYVPFIREIFPQAKLLAMYRDGRDVCVSDRFFRARRGEDWSLEASAQRWHDDMVAQGHYGRDYGLYAISYESLHEDPQPVVTGVLEFLGLDAERALVKRLVERASFESTTGRKRGAEQRKSFNRKGVVGDWHNHFSDGDRETFKRVANASLLSLGYEEDPDW
ncbi:MAG: sulfotransferase [Pseudomonadota bacterium]